MIQEYIFQHEKLNKFNSSSLNTIRIVTTRHNEDVHVLSAMLRIGVGGCVVDNLSSGGIGVGINSQTGKLKKYGCYYSKFNKKARLKHPVSKIKYEGYQLPCWQEVLKLVKDAHEIFYKLPTIGWDVAITRNGPIIIELNVEYSGVGLQAADGGIKEKWYKLKEI